MWEHEPGSSAVLTKKRAKSRNRICSATDSDEGGEEKSIARDDSKTFDTSADLTTGSTKGRMMF